MLVQDGLCVFWGMKSSSEYKILLFILTGLLAIALGLFSMILLQTWREYTSMRQREHLYKEELKQAHQQIRIKEEYFNRLTNDQEFFERIVRQRLGYSRSDEVIFRFEKDTGAPVRNPTAVSP